MGCTCSKSQFTGSPRHTLNARSRRSRALLQIGILVLGLGAFSGLRLGPVLSWDEAAVVRADDSSANSSSEAGTGHAKSASSILIALVVILLSAKLGGALLVRFRQPAVLGELIFGVVLGNLSLFGFHGLDYLKSNEVITILAEIGFIFLLFEVGLESNIREMLEVGLSAFLVAIVGV